MVALRRAADARAAQVPAYAEIIGWHAASPADSHAALQAAYARAGIDPAGIQYIEGHGAATADDDLAELTALLEVLGTDSAPFRFPPAPEQWPQTPVLLAAVNTLGTAPYPDAPRSGPVHVVLRRDRDPARRPGRRRKPVLLAAAPLS